MNQGISRSFLNLFITCFKKTRKPTFLWTMLPPSLISHWNGFLFLLTWELVLLIQTAQLKCPFPRKTSGDLTSSYLHIMCFHTVMDLSLHTVLTTATIYIVCVLFCFTSVAQHPENLEPIVEWMNEWAAREKVSRPLKIYITLLVTWYICLKKYIVNIWQTAYKLAPSDPHLGYSCTCKVTTQNSPGPTEYGRSADVLLPKLGHKEHCHFCLGFLCIMFSGEASHCVENTQAAL